MPNPKRPEEKKESFVSGIPSGSSPEQVIGFDVPRVWANAVQVTPTPETTFIVFREQVGTMLTGSEHIMTRNVASIVVPTIVAKQLAEILNSLIPQVEGSEAAKSGNQDS